MSLGAAEFLRAHWGERALRARADGVGGASGKGER